MKIPIRLVNVPDHRYRKTKQTQVDALAESITEVGLLNPVTVYATDIMPEDSRVFVPGYRLISGEHRLLACKKLGHSEIDAHVVEISELQRQMAECDENLFGPNLTPAERAKLTKRRKQAYEALHPETRKGQGRSKARQESLTAKSAVSDIVAKTGKSERTVRLEAERGEKITDEALALIRGTALDKGDYLDRLKKVEPDKQVAKVKADLATPPSIPGHTSSKTRADVVTEGNMEDGHEEGTETDNADNLKEAEALWFRLEIKRKSYLNAILKQERDPLSYMQELVALKELGKKIRALSPAIYSLVKAARTDPTSGLAWASKALSISRNILEDLTNLPREQNPNLAGAERPPIGELRLRNLLGNEHLGAIGRLVAEIKQNLEDANEHPTDLLPTTDEVGTEPFTDKDIPAFLKDGANDAPSIAPDADDLSADAVTETAG